MTVAVAAAVGVISGSAIGGTLPAVVPSHLIREALACTAVPLWLQQATPIEVLRDTPGPLAFFYPFNHTIYIKATPYLREGNNWDVSQMAAVLGHEFGHAFQRVAAPLGSPAWREFERLTPGFENGPLGDRSYQAWQRNRVEAFAEAYRLLFGGIGAQLRSLVPLSITPAIRAYFQELDASTRSANMPQWNIAARQCPIVAPRANALQPGPDF